MNMIEIIEASMSQLVKVVEEQNVVQGQNVNSSIAEVEIKGIQYQLQISLISEKGMWLGDNIVGFSEAPKENNNGVDIQNFALGYIENDHKKQLE